MEKQEYSEQAIERYDSYLVHMDLQASMTRQDFNALLGLRVPRDRFDELANLSVDAASMEDFFERPKPPRYGNSRGLYQRHRPRGASRSQLQRWAAARTSSVSDRWQLFEGSKLSPGDHYFERDERIREGSRCKIHRVLGLTPRGFIFPYKEGLKHDPRNIMKASPQDVEQYKEKMKAFSRRKKR